jgi:hypothetical protein
MKTASDFFGLRGLSCAPYLSLPLSDGISMPWAGMGCNGFFWETAEYLVYGKGLAQDLVGCESIYRPFLADFGLSTAISCDAPLTRKFLHFLRFWPKPRRFGPIAPRLTLLLPQIWR